MVWFLLKCLEVIFIKIKVKGYLKNITENEIINFEEKAIKNKDKISYVSDGIKTILKKDNNDLVLIREGNDFVNTFLFNNKNSRCNYLLKENGLDVNIDIKTITIDIGGNNVLVKYVVLDSECEYEYKLEIENTTNYLNNDRECDT